MKGDTPKLFSLRLFTVAVILLDTALVFFCRKNLPAELPLHISPDGSYADTMPYVRLFFYPATSLVLALVLYFLSALAFKVFPKADDKKGVRRTLVGIAALCLALIILSSTCVSLTMGRVHFFMYAEPVIALLMIAAIVVGEVRIRKSA